METIDKIIQIEVIPNIDGLHITYGLSQSGALYMFDIESYEWTFISNSPKFVKNHD